MVIHKQGTTTTVTKAALGHLGGTVPRKFRWVAAAAAVVVVVVVVVVLCSSEMQIRGGGLDCGSRQGHPGNMRRPRLTTAVTAVANEDLG